MDTVISTTLIIYTMVYSILYTRGALWTIICVTQNKCCIPKLCPREAALPFLTLYHIAGTPSGGVEVCRAFH